MGYGCPKHVEKLVEEKWKHYLPTGLDHLHAATAKTNKRL